MPLPAPASIRLARTGDVPRLVAVRAAVRENRLSDPASIAAADYVPYIAEAGCWVWEPDGAPAGFAALDFESATIWALFVAPEAEGQGGGRALLAALIAEARRRGLAELRLTTEPGSRAERIYRAAGWQATGESADGGIVMRLAL
jgi:GNAT superfamily N-acetyltransferase